MDFNADRQQYHFSVDHDDVLLSAWNCVGARVGTFRFNAYIIGGILLTEVGSLLAYGLIYLFMGGSFAHTASTMMGQMISTSYINMSIFLAFATLYPDMQVLLYFIIPIKMKWMAAVYVVIMVFSVWDTYHAIYAYTQSVSTALWYAGLCCYAL